MREFRCRCRLAGSVHAGDQDRGWFALRSMDWGRSRRQNARDLRAHRLDHVANSEQSPSLALLERLADSHCHRYAEIGSDYRCLQLVPIDGLAAELFREGFEKVHLLVMSSGVSRHRGTDIFAPKN